MDYDEMMYRLELAIDNLRLLRDAQVPETRFHDHYQAQITALTAELLAWKRQAPMLEQLDILIGQARERASGAQWRANRTAGAWSRATAGAGTGGGFLALLSLAWTPTPLMPVIGVLLLAAAVGAVVLGTRARHRATDEVDRERRVLDGFVAERKQQLPGDAHTGRGRRDVPTGGLHALLGHRPGVVAHRELDPADHGDTGQLRPLGGQGHHVVGELHGGHGDHDATVVDA